LPETNSDIAEHRKFFRLSADSVGRLTCTIPLSPDKTIELESTDICPGGFGAIVPAYCQKDIHKGCEFAHCQINLPGMGDVSVRVAELMLLKTKDGESSLRAGFEFTSHPDWSLTGLESCAVLN